MKIDSRKFNKVNCKTDINNSSNKSSNMKAYISFFKLRFNFGIQYRSTAVVGIITQFTWGFMQILLYTAFYKANPENFPMGLT